MATVYFLEAVSPDSFSKEPPRLLNVFVDPPWRHFVFGKTSVASSPVRRGHPTNTQHPTHYELDVVQERFKKKLFFGRRSFDSFGEVNGCFYGPLPPRFLSGRGPFWQLSLGVPSIKPMFLLSAWAVFGCVRFSSSIGSNGGPQHLG